MRKTGNSTYTIKRLCLGLLVMFLVSFVLDLLPPLFAISFDTEQFFQTKPLPAFEYSVRAAIAAFSGAYVASVPFVVATIVFYVLLSLHSFYILMLIAEPVQPISMFEIIAMNSIGTAFGLVAAVIGADIGFRLAKRRLYELSESV